MIGFALCGSFCTVKSALAQLEKLALFYPVQGIVSETLYGTDTRFSPAKDVVDRIRELTGRDVIHDIVGAEPLGPKIPLDVLIISPCTGNTLAKMANMSDTYFRKKFVRAFGTTPLLYINDLKIAHAVELLRSGYYSVEETAENCGFDNQKYFSTVIKKKTGHTPSEFKK